MSAAGLQDLALVFVACGDLLLRETTHLPGPRPVGWKSVASCFIRVGAVEALGGSGVFMVAGMEGPQPMV